MWAVLVGAVLLAPSGPALATQVAAPATASPVPTQGVPVPATGAYAGAAVGALPGQPYAQAFTDFEQLSGRSLAVHRMYQAWDADPVIGLTRWDAANGTIPAVSIGSPPWGEVARGQHDAAIVRQAQDVKALGAPVLLSFNHEPELDSAALGTPEEYRAAWRHWVGIFRQQGVTNVSFTWILMASSFTRGGTVADSWFPGDDVVDWVGVDGYNWYDVCQSMPWKSFSDVFAGFRAWSVLHPQPLFLAEVGTTEDAADPGRKAQWIADMGSTLKNWPEVKAMAWFNWYPNPGGHDCLFRVDTSATSTAAWSSVVRDPYLAPMLRTTPSFAPPPPAAPSVSAGPISAPAGQPPTVTAQVTTPGATALVRVEHGPTTAYGASTPAVLVPASATPVPVTTVLAALPPLSTVHYRVVVTSRGGTTSTPDAVFRVPGRPTSSTRPALQVLGTTATLAGAVVANGLPTSVSFQYGPSTGFGLTTPAATVPAGWSLQPVLQPVTGLHPGWTYHVRLRATNAAGTTFGPDVVFRAAPLPKADTWLVGARTSSSITARGAVTAGTLATTYSFQYGATTAYGSSTAASVLPAGAAAVPVATVIGGLPARTLVHYRLVVSNAAGSAVGADRTGWTLS